MNRDEMLASISKSFEILNDDELRVIELVASRAALGAKQYGHLQIATDNRDMRREAAFEAIDGTFYLAVAHLKKEPSEIALRDAAVSALESLPECETMTCGKHATKHSPFGVTVICDECVAGRGIALTEYPHTRLVRLLEKGAQ